MSPEYSVSLDTIAKEHSLTPVCRSADYESVKISTSDINRPGLQLAGFYDYFDPQRLQIIGIVETTYLTALSHDERRKSFEAFMSRRPSALIVCHGEEPLPECVEMANKYDVNVLTTEVDTSEFMAQLIGTLRGYLAPRVTRHGVLVEVYGEGLLLTGDSGIGKSETALELINRGHRLIADDAVEIRRVNRRTLVGSAPEIIRYYMELRGIGVIDVRHLYGVGAVRPAVNIDLIVDMEMWSSEKVYDRLGINTEFTDILGVKVPHTTIPVLPGRNLAIIMEVAAMNHRQKKMGYNAALELAKKHDRMVDADGIDKAGD